MRSRLLCLSAVMFFGVCGLVSSQEVPFRDDLSGTLESLRTFGWKIPDAGVRSAGDSIEITASGGERRQVLLDVPVEVGKYYCGSVSVRTENVLPRDNADRGATLFFRLFGWRAQVGEWRRISAWRNADERLAESGDLFDDCYSGASPFHPSLALRGGAGQGLVPRF